MRALPLVSCCSLSLTSFGQSSPFPPLDWCGSWGPGCCYTGGTSYGVLMITEESDRDRRDRAQRKRERASGNSPTQTERQGEGRLHPSWKGQDQGWGWLHPGKEGQGQGSTPSHGFHHIFGLELLRIEMRRSRKMSRSWVSIPRNLQWCDVCQAP